MIEMDKKSMHSTEAKIQKMYKKSHVPKIITCYKFVALPNQRQDASPKFCCILQNETECKLF